ncbi:hypothetical protein [Micromonospora sp. CA-246542]|uniref:hypothetical protein n=1 Tax=Micromonospora sp. CA-246542 TaxID=3239959 RepID=UPI003D8E79ED
MTIDPPAAAASDAPVRPIREWHVLTLEEQAAEWTALVSWVTWIHDLYELSREERLPLCWPQHPGLVEELRSLKFWRDVIYTSRDSAAAHSPRSWHGELRQTLAAAGNFWAPTCRAGHTSAALLSEAHPDLAQRWQTHGPPLMASSPALGPARGLPDTIADAEMATALDQGEARPHSRNMPYYAHLAGAWWTRSSDGATWLRCTDPNHHAHLDDTSARMRAADTVRDQLTKQ